MGIYFSDHFGVDPDSLRRYGALDICVVTDIPVFIDPFLIFNSSKPEYQELHQSILRYLTFLRDKSQAYVDPYLVRELYMFSEVKQNWLGFTLFSNEGQGLGREFAEALHESLASIFADFGEEEVTQGTHIEKLCLIKGGVGRDMVSDFTTNLIKNYLLEYTQEFARRYLPGDRCRNFRVTRAWFNYDTESWVTADYWLPILRSDYVLLTPVNLLTRDETWINKRDMLSNFDFLPASIPDLNLRASINNYFRGRLSIKPTAKERTKAALDTIREFPVLIDYYIKWKEETGDEAESTSSLKVERTSSKFIDQLRTILDDIEAKSDFYSRPWTSYDEALERAKAFKYYIEHQDGYKLLNKSGLPLSSESDVQIFFGLIWCKTDFDINREPNNGRGPVDFKVSFGSKDKSLIEFKLASNSQLKRNLQKQVPIYEAANKTDKSVKVIVCYNAVDVRRVDNILSDLKMLNNESIVVIDARRDNKPSASKA